MSNFNIQGFMSEFKNGFQRPNQYRARLNVAAVGAGANAVGPLGQRYAKACELLNRGLLCESTRTPSRSFETQQMTIFGYEEKFPVFTTYTDIECTFLAPLIDDPAFGPSNQVSELFHAWQTMIQPRASNRFDSGFVDDRDMVLRFPNEYRLAEGFELELLNPYNTKRAEVGVDINLSTTVFAGIPLVSNLPLGSVQIGKRDTNTGASGLTQRFKYFHVFPLTVDSQTVSWDSQNEFQKITVTFAYSYWVTANALRQ